MVALNFNASGVKPNTALEPLPTGQYPVLITASQEKPTKTGTGSYIELEMTVQGGEFANRKVFDRLNIKNPNQQAVDIAYGTLSAICHVTGVINLQDTNQLHGRPFIAVVKKVPRQDQPGNFSNEVGGYKDVNGNDPGKAGTVSVAGAQPGWANNGQQGGQQPQQAQPGPGQYAAQQPQQGGQPQQGQPPQWANNGQPQAQPQQPQGQPQQQVQPQQQMNPNMAPAGAGAPPPWAQQ